MTNQKTPDQNQPQNRPGQGPDCAGGACDTQKQAGSPDKTGQGNGDKKDDGIEEFTHTTPHEAQPERAGQDIGRDDDMDDAENLEKPIDRESEKLIKRNTAQNQTRDPGQGNRDRTTPR